MKTTTTMIYEAVNDLYVGSLFGHFTVEEYDFRSDYNCDCSLDFIRKSILTRCKLIITKRDGIVIKTTSKHSYFINNKFIDKEDLTYEMLKALPR